MYIVGTLSTLTQTILLSSSSPHLTTDILFCFTHSQCIQYLK